MKRFSKFLSIGGRMIKGDHKAGWGQAGRGQAGRGQAPPLLWTVPVCLMLILVVSSQAHADASNAHRASSYSVLGPPTVSAAFINKVLASYQSPAAGTGQALFDDGVTYGVDPVFALAFAGFSAFPTWEAGYVAWYSLIRNVYVDTWGLSTVEQIIPTYAPASDHNNVAGYINAVERAVDAWRSGQIAEFGTAPSASTVSAAPPIIPPAAGTPYPADRYSILGKPTVNGAFIDQVLTQYHSPAAGKGLLFFQEGVK